jgi:predicted transposase YbfD/YdcC
MLSIEGAMVSVDAMGCQRKNAAAILDKKADSLLTLKGNQGILRDDVEHFANDKKRLGFTDAKIRQPSKPRAFTGEPRPAWPPFFTMFRNESRN